MSQPIPIPRDLKVGDILVCNRGERIEFKHYCQDGDVCTRSTSDCWNVWCPDGRNYTLPSDRWIVEIIRANPAKPIEIPIEHRAPNHFVRVTPEIQAAILAPAMERIAALEKAQGATIQAAPNAIVKDSLTDAAKPAAQDDEALDEFRPLGIADLMLPEVNGGWMNADKVRQRIRQLKRDLAAANANAEVANAKARMLDDAARMLDTLGIAKASDTGGMFTVQHRIGALNDETFRVTGAAYRAAEAAEAKRDKALADLAAANARAADNVAVRAQAEAWQSVVDCLLKHGQTLTAQPEPTGEASAIGIIDRVFAERDQLKADLAAANARSEKLETFIRDLCAYEFEDDTQTPIEDLVRHSFVTLAQRSMNLRKAADRDKKLEALLQEWHRGIITGPLREATSAALAEGANP